ncbi:hypothetical protein glysoja_031896 [Glycine soja]|uniref:Uncharacterized protein n=1 Tax=Glycine soja TaxID=3848 RepID=A0A0B2P6G4_GLYSO|nr:hypothetical protein glysoja_031896 [Glycine soja]
MGNIKNVYKNSIKLPRKPDCDENQNLFLCAYFTSFSRIIQNYQEKKNVAT